MTLPLASRLTLICALIFAILLADVSVATPTKEKNDSSTHEKSRPLIGLPTLVVMNVAFLIGLAVSRSTDKLNLCVNWTI